MCVATVNTQNKTDPPAVTGGKREMNQLTLREISRYSVLRSRLDRAEELLLSLREAARPGSSIIDNMPRAPGIKDKVGNLAAEIADLTERIKYLKEEMLQEEEHLTVFINSVDDERLRTIFRLKFLRDLTWMQTTEILGDNYTEEAVKAIAYRYLSFTDT